MSKTLFVLWIWVSAGSNTQTMSMDHFETKEECEAVRLAVLNYHAKSLWDIEKRILEKSMVCLEVKV